MFNTSIVPLRPNKQHNALSENKDVWLIWLDAMTTRFFSLFEERKQARVFFFWLSDDDGAYIQIITLDDQSQACTAMIYPTYKEYRWKSARKQTNNTVFVNYWVYILIDGISSMFVNISIMLISAFRTDFSPPEKTTLVQTNMKEEEGVMRAAGDAQSHQVRITPPVPAIRATISMLCPKS